MSEITTAEYKKYEDAMMNETLPDGDYEAVVMRAQGHPVARVNKNNGNPELFFVAKIVDGPAENRTEMVTCRWFTNEKKQDGTSKTDKEIDSGNRFLRRSTKAIYDALYGKTNENDGRFMSLFQPEATRDEILQSFRLLAGEIADRRIAIKKATKVSDDGTERQNTFYSASKAL